MAYEFKKLSAVEAVETPADTANVLIEENGVIKKTPSSSFAGGGSSSSGGVFLIRVTREFIDGGMVDVVDKSYAEIEAAHNAGLWLYLYAGSNGVPYIFSGWWEKESPKSGFMFEFKSVDSDLHYQIWEDDTLTQS
jgi:hypothetical protein